VTDVHTKQQRSFNMSRIRSKNTKPEMVVRSLVHRLGFRFRLHHKNLPGKPDLVFSSRQKVIFVHGCYWHMHSCRYGQVVPKTNAEFWQKKRLGNVRRDNSAVKVLQELGWQVLVIWECEIKDIPQLEKTLKSFLVS
jgi:DNA mismatch endonuclease, patch repair protein